MKDIVGYEGLYRVSVNGQVYNMRGMGLKQQTHKKGYKVIGLRKDGKVTTHSVHRLVAIAHIPTADLTLHVDHKDENKANNCVSNLRWCTPSGNMNYFYANHPEKYAVKPVKMSEEALQEHYTQLGNSVHVNGTEFRSSRQAAEYITQQEQTLGIVRNTQTIRKEIQKFIQGKRPAWVMYEKYAIS